MTAWENFAIHHKILIVFLIYYILGLLMFFSITYRFLCHTSTINMVDLLLRPMFWLGTFIWPALPVVNISGIC